MSARTRAIRAEAAAVARAREAGAVTLRVVVGSPLRAAHDAARLSDLRRRATVAAMERVAAAARAARGPLPA